MIILKLRSPIYLFRLLKDALVKKKHYYIAEACYFNIERLFIYMYTHLFLLSQVAINTKERINLQTETNKHSFLAIIHCLCHSSCMLMLAGQ